jgi:RimJ/RimL family protein N-acetyltransferase
MNLSHWEARPLPQRIALEGRYTRLEPIDPARHGDALFAASTEESFRYLFESPGPRQEFEAWLNRMAASNDPLCFAVVDKTSGRAEGRQSLMRITPEHGVIEIGGILWGPSIARTRVATEALYLFARYVFDSLGYRRFEWKCHSDNAPSRRAALRFGFMFEGIFRQHMVLKGANRDTAWFAMMDHEWIWLRQAYEAWLDSANFESDGRQVQKLADLIRNARGRG